MKSTNTTLVTAAAAVALIAFVSATSTAHAGGLIGDAINQVAPGVGTHLDEVHRDMGKPLDRAAAAGVAVAVAPVTIPAAIAAPLIAKPIENVSHAIASDFNGAVTNLQKVATEGLGAAHATFMEMLIEASIVLFALFAATKIFSVVLSVLFRKRATRA